MVLGKINLNSKQFHAQVTTLADLPPWYRPRWVSQQSHMISNTDYDPQASSASVSARNRHGIFCVVCPRNATILQVPSSAIRSTT